MPRTSHTHGQTAWAVRSVRRGFDEAGTIRQGWSLIEMDTRVITARSIPGRFTFELHGADTAPKGT
ncbi:MAG: hypothetical protein OXF56_15730, partial [Rhodobacteraceae bacterium]|nr:hypothetical protein [Paracoccaceae bacterium]